LSNSA
jgi:hypothetical protein